MPDHRPIDHARALVQAGRDGVPPPPEVVAWAAGGLALHLQHGVALGQALGLVRYGGGGGHAGIERRRQRDELLRDLARRHFVGMVPRAAAAAILAALDAQRRARGRVEGDLARVLETLLHFDPPVPDSPRQLRRVLANNRPF